MFLHCILITALYVYLIVTNKRIHIYKHTYILSKINDEVADFFIWDISIFVVDHFKSSCILNMNNNEDVDFVLFVDHVNVFCWEIINYNFWFWFFSAKFYYFVFMLLVNWAFWLFTYSFLYIYYVEFALLLITAVVWRNK